MVKFLRRIAVFIGVVLLVMTAGLWRLRETHAAPESHLLFWENIVDRQSSYAYYQLIEGADEPFLMRSGKRGIYDRSEIFGVSPDKQWLYFSEFPLGGGCGGAPPLAVYRIRPDGSHRQTLIEQAVHFQWATDQTALIYTGYEEGGFGLYRMGADGSAKTKLFSPENMFIWDMVIPTHNEQIFVTASDETTSRIYAVDFKDGHTQELIHPLGDTVQLRLRFVTPDNRWLILTDNNRVYRMRTDGTDFMELSNWASGDAYYRVSLLQNDVLLVQNGRGYNAIRISTGERLWSLQNSLTSLAQLNFHAGPEWVIFWFNDISTYQMTTWLIKADGSQQRQFAPPPAYAQYGYVNWSTDGQDVYYATIDTLHRFNLGTMEDHIVAQTAKPPLNAARQMIDYLGMSDDGDWVYYAEFDFPTAYLYKAHPDGTQKSLMISLPVSEWFALGDRYPQPLIQDTDTIEAGWEPIQLLMTGVLFIVLGIRQPLRIRIWG